MAEEHNEAEDAVASLDAKLADLEAQVTTLITPIIHPPTLLS
jgi:hypothetical protein